VKGQGQGQGHGPIWTRDQLCPQSVLGLFDPIITVDRVLQKSKSKF